MKDALYGLMPSLWMLCGVLFLLLLGPDWATYCAVMACYSKLEQVYRP